MAHAVDRRRRRGRNAGFQHDGVDVEGGVIDARTLLDPETIHVGAVVRAERDERHRDLLPRARGGRCNAHAGLGHVVDHGHDLDGLPAGGSAVDLEREDSDSRVVSSGRVGGAQVER